MRLCTAALWQVTIGLVAFAPSAGAQNAAPVRIRGGADGSGHNYEWIVENHSDQPIVWIEFPHFRADTFIPPTGWKFECTHLSRVGSGRPRPGVCRAWVDSPAMGIAPGGSARFRMRIARAGALRRYGTVRLKLADGTQVSLDGVELPAAPSVGERYVLLIGLALLLGLIGWVAYRNQKRARAQAPQRQSDEATE